MSLTERLLKNSTIKLTATLDNSKLFKDSFSIPTPVPMINVALSGSVDGGLTPGLTMIAGPSKHFKTGFALLMISSFLKQYPDGVVLFYDSEFGAPEDYFKGYNIPLDKIIHVPVEDVEQLKHDLTVQLEGIERNDKVMIFVDSIGNIASRKEVEDAIDGKSVADMTRAKALKSLFRIVTPKLTLKNLPMVVINHTYKEIGMFPKDIVGGGTGSVYNSSNIWILGRQQDKDGNELAGYHFIINVEKSRFVKEKSKIPITINYETGINKWSGLLDLAIEAGIIVKPKNGWYAFVDPETGEIGTNKRASELENNRDFWRMVFDKTSFATWLKEKYTLVNGSIISEDTDEAKIEEE